jgi:hypothetical protein
MRARKILSHLDKIRDMKMSRGVSRYARNTAQFCFAKLRLDKNRSMKITREVTQCLMKKAF